MSLLNKRERGIGFAKGDTWGTAVEPGTGHGIYLLRFSPPKGDRNLITDGDEFDHDLPTNVYPMDYPEQGGSMGGRFYWAGMERILASIFGIYTSSAPESGVVKHEFTFDPIIGSIFHSLAWDEGDEIKSVPSFKFKNLRIFYDDGFQWDTDIGGDRTVIASWSDPLSLTYGSEGLGIWRLVNTTISINAQGGADFAAGDAIHPSAIDINIDPKYTTLPVTAGYEGISEHEPGDDPPEFTVALKFPKKDTTNNGFLTSFSAGTKYKMRIKCESSAVISGKTSKYTFQLDLPGLYVVEAPEYAQESPVPVAVKFGIYRPSAAPTGMSAAVPYASIINEVPALTGYPAS
jgi:hypothetical protein